MTKYAITEGPIASMSAYMIGDQPSSEIDVSTCPRQEGGAREAGQSHTRETRSNRRALVRQWAHRQEAEHDVVERDEAVAQIIGVVVRHAIKIRLTARRILAEEAIAVQAGALPDSA